MPNKKGLKLRSRRADAPAWLVRVRTIAGRQSKKYQKKPGVKNERSALLNPLPLSGEPDGLYSFNTFMITCFEVGVLLLSARLLTGTSTLVSGK